MSNLTNLTTLEINCLQVALDDLIDVQKDVISDAQNIASPSHDDAMTVSVATTRLIACFELQLKLRDLL